MMDEIDRRLLALLRANAREPAASLAKKLKVSRGTVQNRIARMLAARHHPRLHRAHGARAGKPAASGR